MKIAGIWTKDLGDEMALYILGFLFFLNYRYRSHRIRYGFVRFTDRIDQNHVMLQLRFWHEIIGKNLKAIHTKCRAFI